MSTLKKKKAAKKNFKTVGVPLRTLKRYYPILDQISKLKNKGKVNQVIDSLPVAGVDSICECLYNALYSKKLSRKSLHRLKSLPPGVKDQIRAIAFSPRRRRFKKRKELIKQSGGSISDIIASVLPILAAILI